MSQVTAFTETQFHPYFDASMGKIVHSAKEIDEHCKKNGTHYVKVSELNNPQAEAYREKEIARLKKKGAYNYGTTFSFQGSR